MENCEGKGIREVLLEPLDYGGKAHNDQNMWGIDPGPSKFLNGRLNGALHDKGGESGNVSSHFDEELEPEAIGSGPGFVMDDLLGDLKSEQAHRQYEEVGGHQFIRYGIDELLGLWEVSVNCETTWNHVCTALSPLMEEVYEMQAMPDTKYQRRRSKNSERRQRFKAKREAMLSISQNKQDSDNTQIQKGPLKGHFKPRQYQCEYVESFQPQAFAVDGEPDFESGDPEDGWEYLRRVIWEAARCPKVVVANIDPEKLVSEQTSYMPKFPPIPSCPPELLPSNGWENMYLADFKQLRKELSKLLAPAEPSSERLPSVRDNAAWEILCFGAVTSTQAEDLEEPESVTFGAKCGASPGHEEIVGATDEEFICIHPPFIGTSNDAVSGEKRGIDKVSDSPLLDELEQHSTSDDTRKDDLIELGLQQGTAAEHLHPTEALEAYVISASRCTVAPETYTPRVQDPTEDHSVPYEYEGSSEATADLGVSRTALGSDLSDRLSDSPLLDDLEEHSTRDDTGKDDSIELGLQEGTAAERLHPTGQLEADVISASRGTIAPETYTPRLQDPTGDHSMPYEYEGSSEVTADLGVSRTALGNDLADPNESHQEDYVDKVVLRHVNLAASDVQGPVAPLLVKTGLQLKLEEEVSAEDGVEISTATILTNSCVQTLDVAELSGNHAEATEFAEPFDRWPESSGLGVHTFIPEDTSESRDLLYGTVDPRGDDGSYKYPAESYEYAVHSLEAPEFEDDYLQTADLMESLSGYEVFRARNILEESEDEGRQSISDIDKSVQQLFTRVFRVDEAWELPLIHTLLRLDVVSRATLFRYHVSWLDSVEDLPRERALWLLGLAAVVDTPLSGDTTAAFRALLRYCARVRASKKVLSDEELHMLSSLSTVAGLYFGQAEADLT